MTTGEVVLCTKVPADLARRFDERAAPNRSAALRRLVEDFVGTAAVTAVFEVPVAVSECPHPDPVSLATGLFCPLCRSKVTDG